MAVTTSNPQGTFSNTGATSATFAYTATASTTMLIVMVSTRSGTSATSMTCTYNGVSMTAIGSVAHGTSKVTQNFFYLASPPTGSSYNIVASWTNNNKWIIEASCLLGSDTAAPTGYNSFASSSNTDSLAITSASGDIVISCFSQNTTGATVLTPSETRLNNDISTNAGSTDHTSGTSYTTATGVSTTMTWNSTLSGNYVSAGFSVAAAAGGGPTYDGKFFLMF